MGLNNRPRIEVLPLTLEEGRNFILAKHRHHAPPQGHKWSTGAYREGKLIGVSCVGRPVARRINQRTIVEVTRLANGSQDACSALYGAAARAARELGYFAILTYTLAEEEGTSLRAAGWWPEKATTAPGQVWGVKSRPREVKKGVGLGEKIRWVRFLREWSTLDEAFNPHEWTAEEMAEAA
jgi:hypothetical protein